MWWILGIVAAFAFFVIGREGRTTATGGGATAGLVIGIVLALIYGNWWLVGRAVIVGILIGLAFEMLALVPRLWTR
ncbi:MAG: hypothetical protein K2W81_11625 [Sphingomonas sp.]|uniref:hypothetical protein n=1 Tax=Sphingomonas sp. TaxID=28214 RepID=UPI0025D6002E|nr:hypothetical protein [Sphingomonas sp.]MBY0284599.1 hypothetical protein [Sphingomonas sp.]